MLLINGGGGTDVCSAIVSGCALQPVVRGEMAGRWLGVDATAFDPDGREVTGELGELGIRQPMPSRPVGFSNDHDGSPPRVPRGGPGGDRVPRGAGAPAADAVDAGRLLERPRRLPLPRGVLRHVP